MFFCFLGKWDSKKGARSLTSLQSFLSQVFIPYQVRRVTLFTAAKAKRIIPSSSASASLFDAH